MISAVPMASPSSVTMCEALIASGTRRFSPKTHHASCSLIALRSDCSSTLHTPGSRSRRLPPSAVLRASPVISSAAGLTEAIRPFMSVEMMPTGSVRRISEAKAVVSCTTLRERR